MSDALLCAAVDGFPPHMVVSGSIIGKCSGCGCEVYIAISGQAALAKNKDMSPMCMKCAEPLMKGENELQLAPGVIEETIAHFRNRKKPPAGA